MKVGLGILLGFVLFFAVIGVLFAMSLVFGMVPVGVWVWLGTNFPLIVIFLLCIAIGIAVVNA